MKRTRILSTLALTTASIVCLIPVASAEEPVEKTKTAEITVSQSSESIVETSQLILVGSDQTQTIEIKDQDKTIEALSEEYGFKLEDYKNTSGDIVDPAYKIPASESLVLFKSESSASSETIELTIPTIEEETDELYIGEKEVESEGKVGEALKTTITTKDLSADKSINKEAVEEKEASVSEKLTILVAPEPKVVLVGTKEKPEPVEIETEEVVEEEVSENAEAIERDPISGEPLNASDETVSIESAPLSSSAAGGMSGYSSANGANVKASSKSPSEIVSGNGTRGQKAVELAYTRLGSDYNWASSGDNAFDCSGLIYWIYNDHLGVDIPRVAKQQGSSSQQISLNQLQPGDLLWTNSHIGMYIGNGQMIHASRSNDAVVVSGIGWFVDDGAKAARIR